MTKVIIVAVGVLVFWYGAISAASIRTLVEEDVKAKIYARMSMRILTELDVSRTDI